MFVESARVKKNHRPFTFSPLFYLCLAILIVAFASQAQLSQLYAQVFEGLRVVEINLRSQPPVDEAELRPLVTQRAGEPYSAEKIRESIVALYRTGRFIDVRVEARPVPGGVAVTFVLQPAFYTGAVAIEGLNGKVPETRLLAAANLPLGEPLTEQRSDSALSAIKSTLRAAGYFEAKVEPHVRYDQALQLADIIFVVELGPQAKVGTIEIAGAAGLDKNAILSALGLEPGDRFSAEKLDRARQSLRAFLARRDLLAAEVKVTERSYDPSRNRLDLLWEINPGPRVIISASGADLSRRKLRELVPIFEERTFDSDLVEEGRRNIINHFQTRGYFDANVLAELTRGRDRIELVYRIDPGPHKHRLTAINFSGNSHFSDHQLERIIPIEEAGIFARGRFSDDLLEASERSIEAAYRQQGFEQASVKGRAEDTNGDLFVHFQIEEGPRTFIDSVDFIGNRQLSRDALLANISLRPGAPYSERLLLEDRNRILATYLDRGYPNARVEARVERVPNGNSVQVLFDISEGTRVTVEAIAVRGNRHTRTDFILNELHIEPGAPLSEGKILEEQAELYALGIFDRVDIAPRRPISGQNEELLVVRVNEARRNTLTYGLGFEFNRRGRDIRLEDRVIDVEEISRVSDRPFLSPRGSIELTRRNLRGRGESATIGLSLSRLQARGILSYADPRFLLPQWDSLFTLFLERTEEIRTFTANRFDAAFQLQRPLGPFTTLLLRYNFRNTRLSNINIPVELIPRRDREVRLSTLSASWVRDTRDQPLDPSEGNFYSFDLGVTPEFIGSQSNFVRIFAQAADYRRLSGTLVWANSFRLGLAAPFGGDDDIPLSERFFAGGANTLRGFPQNEAGPHQLVRVPDSDLVIPVPLGGNALIILNSELRFPLAIMERLGGAIFYDGGNAFRRISQIDLDRWAHIIGVGLRYRTPFGPVRLDLGYNLNERAPGQRPLQFYFSIGQAF